MSVYQNVYGGRSGGYTGSPFATRNDVISIYGKQFIEDYVADITGGEFQTGTSEDFDPLDDAIEEAHNELLTYLLLRYDEAELRGTFWVVRREARLAGYYLASRRAQGIPESIASSRASILEDVESMANDTRRTIPGVPTRHVPGPQVSNFNIDNRFLKNRQRRDTFDSTSSHSGARDTTDTRNAHE